MIADVKDLLAGKMQTTLHEGPGTNIGSIFPLINIVRGIQGIDILLKS